MSVQPDGPRSDWRERVRGSRTGNIVVLVITAVAVLVGWLVMRPDPSENQVSEVDVTNAAVAPEVGDRAPGFTATALDGSPVELAVMAGRPVWLVFMATWCSACRAEMPDVQEAWQQAGPDGVQVVAIYVGEGSTVVAPYAERLSLTMPQVPDRQTDLSAAYGVMGVPAHYFIDASGTVQHTWVGVLSPSQIEDGIAKASA